MKSSINRAQTQRSVHSRILEFLNAASRPVDLMDTPPDLADPGARRDGRADPGPRRPLFSEEIATRILEVRDDIGPFGFVHVGQLTEVEGVANDDIEGLFDILGPAVMGAWTILKYNIPIPGLARPSVAHAALLHTGKVLFIPEHEGANNYPTPIWDPADESVGRFESPTVDPLYSLFCGGHSFLSDGRLFVAGGGGNAPTPVATRGHLFDPATRAWTSTATDMNHARWYPTVLTLGDQRLLITCGNRDGNMQIYNERTGDFEDIEGDTERFPHLYPGLHLLPDHRIFYSRTGWGSAGADDVQPHDDSGYFEFTPPVAGAHAGTWKDIRPAVSAAHRAKGMSVMLLQPVESPPGQEAQPRQYRVRVLVVGGAHGDPTYELIDVSNLSPSSEWDGPVEMPDHESRRHCNAVLLPDGTVFVSGGGTGAAPIPSALFDPADNTWTRMATPVSPRTRSYHGVSLLLPSGKVMVAGSQSESIELFSPPYLFRGPQPVIRDCPTEVMHGTTFSVLTPYAPDITSVALVRPMAVTHQTDTEQRVLNLAFSRTASSGELLVTAPSAEYPHSLAPPGYYMLFILDRHGVPSVAHWVRLVSPRMLLVPDRTPIASHGRNSDHMELWLVDTFGVVRGNYWNGGWHEWYSLYAPTGFPKRGHVAVLGRHRDHMEIFAVGNDGRLHHNWWDGDWHDWRSLGAPNVPGLPPGVPALVPGCPLAVVTRFRDHMEVFVVAADGQVHHIWWDGDNWRGWNALAGAVFPRGAPLAAHRRHDDHMEIWGIDTAGVLHGNWWNGHWNGWYSRPTPPNEFGLQPGGHLAALGRHSDHMEVWTIGTDDRLHGIWWNGTWQRWYTLDGPFSFPPGGPLAVTSRNNDHMEVWAAGDDDRLHGIWWDDSWRDWYSRDQIIVPRGTPLAVISRTDDHMDVWGVAPVDPAQLNIKVHWLFWNGHWSTFHRVE